MAPPSRGTVLVTGAGGFAARLLVATLLDAGYVVKAADVRPPPTLDDPNKSVWIADQRANWIVLDITSLEDVRKHMSGCDSVFHFAALVPYNLPRAFAREELFRVNVIGTENLLDAAQAAGVRNFIYASSTGVVFRGSDIALGDESLNCKPPLNDDYSDSKAAAESAVLQRNSFSGMATIALRPNGLWGSGGEAHHTPKLLSVAQLGLAPLMAVQPSALTDFTHRKNFVHACELALSKLQDQSSTGRALVGGKSYFVTDGWPCHTLEFFSPLLAELGFSAPFPYAFIPRGSAAVDQSKRVSLGEFSALISSIRGDVTLLREISAPVVPPVKRRRGSSARTGPGLHFPELGSVKPVPQEVIITTEPWLPLPGWVLLFSAAVLQSTFALFRPLVNVEPFLTVADARKVVHHNYYSNEAARRELGYIPIVGPAEGLRDAISYYRTLGYDGAVPTAGWLPWILAPGGIGLTGALAGDFGKVGTVFATRVLAVFPSLAPALITLRGQMQWLVSSIGFAKDKDIQECLPQDPHNMTLMVLHWVFVAAVLAHCLEAVWVFHKAWMWNKAAGHWFIQTLWLGFPSMRLLYEKSGKPSTAIVSICMVLFSACALVSPVLDTVLRCKRFCK